MSKHLIKIDNPQHCAISVAHAGLDNQYCEAGEVVAIDWQPSSGWGLQEAHYTDEDGNIVSIDLSLREFTMPAKAIVVSGTAKRFVIEDWTGKDSAFSILGSFDEDKLPTLNGMNDAGKLAFNKTSNQYVYWNGVYWVRMSDGRPVFPQYLKFIAYENGGVAFFYNNANTSLPQGFSLELEYSTDGVNWFGYIVNEGEDAQDAQAQVIVLNEGESVLFRGLNENVAAFNDQDEEWIFLNCYIQGRIGCFGDVTALLNGWGGDIPVPQSCYVSMFRGCTGLVQAPALPATTLGEGCYGSMFSGCTGLVQAPALPAIILAGSCYVSMFNGCTGLTSAPALPATTLASGCYGSMFSGCTGLVQAPALPAIILAANCYSGMFKGCTGLTEAPVLPATTLASGCYGTMFSGCTHIASYDVATLNNSINTFQNNSSCASLTIHDETPPTIATSTITGLKADCVIYVPAGSVNAYKAKQYWSARASYIQAIP